MINTRNEQIKLFDAKAATGSTIAYLVQDFQHVFLTSSTASSANYTMKFQISNQPTTPDFSAAASPSNQWSYVQVKDLITNSAIDGATGISAAGSDATRIFEVNTNGQKWFGATITAYSAGAITLSVAAKTNS